MNISITTLLFFPVILFLVILRMKKIAKDFCRKEISKFKTEEAEWKLAVMKCLINECKVVKGKKGNLVSYGFKDNLEDKEKTTSTRRNLEKQ